MKEKLDAVVGDEFELVGSKHPRTIKIMAVKDGYAMARVPRAIPFVISLRNLLERGFCDEHNFYSKGDVCGYCKGALIHWHHVDYSV